MYPLIWPGQSHCINKLNHWGWWRSSTEFSDDIRCTVWFMNDCLPISDLHLNNNNRGSFSCFPFPIPWASLCFSVHISHVEISVLIEPIPFEHSTEAWSDDSELLSIRTSSGSVDWHEWHPWLIWCCEISVTDSVISIYYFPVVVELYPRNYK